MRAILRKIRDPAQAKSWHSNLVGLELRIEQGGELRQSEMFREIQALMARSRAILNTLIEKGRKPAQ